MLESLTSALGSLPGTCCAGLGPACGHMRAEVWVHTEGVRGCEGLEGDLAAR